MDEYDVIVVGAGPSGCMAAREVAKAGRSVLVLEKHPAIGAPLCCAEAISHIGLCSSIPLDERWISARLERIRLYPPSGKVVLMHHPQAGYVLDRKRFDRYLAQLAAQAGARVLVNAQVIALLKRDGRIRGVKVNLAGKETEVQSRLVIAADGVESQIGLMAGIETTLGLEQIDSCAQFLVGGVDFDQGSVEFHFSNAEFPGGYGWVFPKGDGCVNIGMGITPARFNGTRSAELLRAFADRRFGQYSILEMMTGGVPSYLGEKLLVKGNLLLVGDAARFIDSLTGAGIANAMLSGRIAGEVVAEHLNSNRGEEHLREYPARLLKLKGKEMRHLKLARELYLKMTDRDFDEVVEFVGGYFGDQPISGINALEMIGRIVSSHPRLLLLARHFIW